MKLGGGSKADGATHPVREDVELLVPGTGHVSADYARCRPVRAILQGSRPIADTLLRKQMVADPR